mmetsp:Transcript_10443/g.31380  ORF Transcript_10443/g.31380 Transcript_10443/m.31380 type:complete len:96 (+) Transcript_10443:80-367(+)
MSSNRAFLDTRGKIPMEVKIMIPSVTMAGLALGVLVFRHLLCDPDTRNISMNVDEGDNARLLENSSKFHEHGLRHFFHARAMHGNYGIFRNEGKT